MLKNEEKCILDRTTPKLSRKRKAENILNNSSKSKKLRETQDVSLLQHPISIEET